MSATHYLFSESRPVLLVTGTSRGIGRFLAEYYSQKGYQVVGVSRAEATFESDNYQHVSIDISSEEQVLDLFSRVRKSNKRLDVLINCAAINPSVAPLALTSLKTLNSTIAVNFIGAFLTAREAVKLMLLRKWGRIINVSSMAVKHEVAGEMAYTASKAALGAMSRVLAKEVAAMGITCNVVAPSAIKTDLSAAINQQALQEVLSRNAIADFGNLADVSNVIDFLIRAESQAVTGQLIYLGGV